MNGVNYTWDNNGNLLNDGVNAYTYDSANRLKTFTNITTTATYAYNGLNDRLQETVNGSTTTFTMDLNTGLTQALSDGTNTYIYGLGRIAQVNTTTEYFLGDALGSVRQLTNSTGAITYARAYDPYGVVTSTSGSSQTAYGYTSEYYGDSTQLLYLRSRYYASGTGRFLTRDTWGGNANSPMSYNKWMYVEGNPLNATDPTGNITEQETERADNIVKMLQERFAVQIQKDWGYILVPVDTSSLPPSILSGILYGCKWEPGKWDFVELRTIRDAVKDLGKAMNGDNQFRKFIGSVIVKKADKTCGRGCTPYGGRDIIFQNKGNLPTNVDISNSATTIDKWAVVHEFGHAWDRNRNWALSWWMMDYAGGYYSKPQQLYCDPSHRLPGCNISGYYYGNLPPAGSDDYFNHQEDFAEAVAAFVYPETAQSKVQDMVDSAIKSDPSHYYLYYRYLYYTDYTQTSRWKFVNGLINLGTFR